MIARLKAAEGSDSSDSGISAMEKQVRTKSSRLMHTAGNLFVTAKDFRHGANLWRRGKLEKRVPYPSPAPASAPTSVPLPEVFYGARTINSRHDVAYGLQHL